LTRWRFIDEFGGCLPAVDRCRRAVQQNVRETCRTKGQHGLYPWFRRIKPG